MKKLLLFILLSLFTLSFAQVSSVTAAASNLCSGLQSLLPVASMLMIILAGVIYAAGQIMGAETRARANVWATACVTGAMIGILIVVVAPSVFGMMYGSSFQCVSITMCSGQPLQTGYFCCSNSYAQIQCPSFLSCLNTCGLPPTCVPAGQPC